MARAKQKHAAPSIRKAAVVVFSGGPDSTAAALWAISKGYDIRLLSFRFFEKGQDGELRSAQDVAEKLHLRLTVVDLRGLLAAYDGPIHPMMHGTLRENERPSRSTYMPFGAAIFLSIAASLANHWGIRTVVWGATLDDQVSRGDYTATYCKQLAALLSSGSDGRVSILTPFSDQHKFRVLRAFEEREDLFSSTWSCGAGREAQCGIDHACVARRVAAEVAGIADRTSYETQAFANPIEGLTQAQIKHMTKKQWAHILDCEKEIEMGKLNRR